MYGIIKRGLDIILALLGLMLLLPFLLMIAAAIRIDSKGPVIFCQKRVGIHKTYFFVYKFRTMRIDAPGDIPTHLMHHPQQYFTKVGKFLRKTSIDELPQIWNILIGQMSIIGPRPALWNQENLIAEREKYGANDIRPGLTGWAQINGRDKLSIEEKAKLDGEYVKNLGFMIDLKCFFRTIIRVMKGDGIMEGSTEESKAVNEASSENVCHSADNRGE